VARLAAISALAGRLDDARADTAAPPPVTTAPAAAASSNADRPCRVSETRALLTTDPAGTATLAIQRSSILHPTAWPMLSLSAESGAVSLSYGVLLDVKDPAASFQRVALGVLF
jgi:hypothetical protein